MKNLSPLRVVQLIGLAGCIALIVFLDVLGLLAAPQLMLPLLPRSRRGLVFVVIVYALAWAFIWHEYHLEVAADPMNADNRGMTGALFLGSNVAFSAGLALRLVASSIDLISRWYKNVQERAV